MPMQCCSNCGKQYRSDCATWASDETLRATLCDAKRGGSKNYIHLVGTDLEHWRKAAPPYPPFTCMGQSYEVMRGWRGNRRLLENPLEVKSDYSWPIKTVAVTAEEVKAEEELAAAKKKLRLELDLKEAIDREKSAAADTSPASLPTCSAKAGRCATASG